MKSIVAKKNVYLRWYKVDWFGGQKTTHWFGLSFENGTYYRHFYQNCGTMKQEITEKEFKECFELYMKNEDYDFEIIPLTLKLVSIANV